MTPIFATIDTNVLVSALITKKSEAATVLVMEAVFSGKIKPLYNQKILDEYEEVLHRPKFHIENVMIRSFIDFIRTYGFSVNAISTGEKLKDPDDLVFYEVTMTVPNAKLITGNIKHFPIQPNIITPAQMVKILNERSSV